MKQVSIQEAKKRLLALVDEASRGETIVITRSGTPVAQLVPLNAAEPRRPIRFGSLQGKIWIADDFDALLPEWLLDAFEGKYDDDPDGLEEAARNDPTRGAKPE